MCVCVFMLCFSELRVYKILNNNKKFKNELGLNLTKRKLTGKKLGAIGPPGIPSFGGNCPIGLGAGPAFCIYVNNQFVQKK